MEKKIKNDLKENDVEFSENACEKKKELFEIKFSENCIYYRAGVRGRPSPVHFFHDRSYMATMEEMESYRLQNLNFVECE